MFTQPRVLIVDDDLNTRVTIEAMLALENYE